MAIYDQNQSKKLDNIMFKIEFRGKKNGCAQRKVKKKKNLLGESFNGFSLRFKEKEKTIIINSEDKIMLLIPFENIKVFYTARIYR